AFGAGLHGVVDRVGGVVGVGHEHSVQEADEAARVAMVMSRVIMSRVIMSRVIIPRVTMSRVVMFGAVRVMGHGRSCSLWWWVGVWPSATECSAWKMASDTSWEACSFAKR